VRFDTPVLGQQAVTTQREVQNAFKSLFADIDNANDLKNLYVNRQPPKIPFMNITRWHSDAEGHTESSHDLNCDLYPPSVSLLRWRFQ
jgi:hypothetical protein